MIDYNWHETNTEVVLTFTGDTNEILNIIDFSGFDLAIGMTPSELDGLLEIVTEKYDYEPKSSDPDDWKWLTVAIDNGFIKYSHTFTESGDMHHIINIRNWSYA
jgi:hypothetical protein